MPEYFTASRNRSPEGETGTRLESEFLGEVNKSRYKELVYTLLHKDELDSAVSPDKKFEIMMKIRDEAQKDFDNILNSAQKGKFINFKNSVRLVEQAQMGNPEKPSRFFSGALHNYIKNRFEDKYILKFFTATGGTHLDILHGVDGFFKLYSKESGRELSLATIDLTKNPTKDRAKADVIIYINGNDLEKYDPSRNNSEFDRNFFNKQVQKFSEEIIKSLVE
ncbi:MAG: hypothetical protein ACD_15C00070G0001, partial [uncultured bacterium]